MQLAFSSNAYMNFSIEETIARIAAIGYSGIEVLSDVPHRSDSEMEPYSSLCHSISQKRPEP